MQVVIECSYLPENKKKIQVNWTRINKKKITLLFKHKILIILLYENFDYL